MRERPDVFVAGHEAIDRIGDDAATQVIRIGTIAGKGADDAVFKAIRRLDDVHSDTHHDVGDGLGLGIEACLAQDAAYLASIDEHVVDPLDLGTLVRVLVDGVSQTTGGEARDERDVFDCEARAQNERKVHARVLRRKEGAALSAAAGALGVRDDESALRRAFLRKLLGDRIG